MKPIVDENYKIIFSEVYDILSFLEKDELNKIPSEFTKFIKLNKSETYVTSISPYLPLEMQNLKKETKDIIAFIYRKYMSTETEKVEFSKQDKLRLQKVENKKKELYNSDNIFKTEKDYMSNFKTENLDSEINTKYLDVNLKSSKANNGDMLIVRENVFYRIIHRIKLFINKVIRH